MKFKYANLFFLALISILSSCGVSYVYIPVTRPAEINMSDFKQITVGDIANQYDRADRFFESTITTALYNSKKFEVLDRKNLDKILSERNLTMDAITRTGSTQAGNLIAATALISGTVITSSVNEDVKVENSYQDKKGNTHTNYIYSAKANVIVNFIVTDLSSGRIIYTKEIEKNKEDKQFYEDRPKERYDKYKLLNDTKKQVVDEFLKKIMPYEEKVGVPFKTESDAFDKGIDFARYGKMKEAINYFETKTKEILDKEVLSKAYFNLGLSYMYSYDFENAKTAFKKADDIYHDEEYMRTLSNCEKMEGEQQQVKEQLKK